MVVIQSFVEFCRWLLFFRWGPLSGSMFFILEDIRCSIMIGAALKDAPGEVLNLEIRPKGGHVCQIYLQKVHLWGFSIKIH